MDLVVLLILSFTLKITLINDLIIETIKEGNISLINTNNEETNNVLNNETIKELLEKEEVKEFVNEYIDEFLENIVDENNDFESSSLQEDMIEYIKEHKEELSNSTGVEITDEQIEKASTELNNIDNKKYFDQNINNIKNSTPKEIKMAIRLIDYITSQSLRLIVILLIIIDIVLMIIIDKSFYRWIRSLSISFIGAGLQSLIITKLISLIVKNITKITVKVNTLNNTGIIILIIGVVLFITYIIINNLLKEKDNEIS